jgi:hypothetical protein
MENARIILYHKQPTSARILFLRLNGTVCQLQGLPSGAKMISCQIEDEGEATTPPSENLIPTVEEQLKFTQGTLALDAPFQAIVEAEGNELNVYLAQFTSTDAPHEAVADIEGKLIAVTEARTLPPVELELLKQVYAFLMDG